MARVVSSLCRRPIGHGIALPHLRLPVALGREAGLLALLFLREPLVTSESSPDPIPVTRLLFFIAPSPRAHLELLARLSAALSHGGARSPVIEARPDAEILAALTAEDAPDAADGGRDLGA